MFSPTSAGSSDVTAPVTKMFSETSGKKPRALAAQIGKSQLMAHSKPPPTAHPLMAPTTGLAPKTMASVARWMASTSWRASASLSGWTCASRSSPAQNARPAPVKMMARVSGSALASSKACATSSMSWAFMAFSRSGRFSATVLTPCSSRSLSTVG